MSCPNCLKPTTAEFKPFCSKRCADIDLHHWFSERYSVAVEQEDEDDIASDEDVENS